MGSNVTSHNMTSDNGTAPFLPTNQLPKFLLLSSYCGFLINSAACLLNLLILIVILRFPRLITAFTIHVFTLNCLNVFSCASQYLLLVSNVDRTAILGTPIFCGPLK
ncbi:hypothetical protein BV898_15318 [Hypsibius exemplaris]|uniref:Uncharacterized protein n=1 Tax=Hypsibius exemplaris TaxID=2072580 RepID=A0A9X6RKD6_HYPEX|nr:hypothetical protein BV898_15318 [Hypsibius exemplaris]